jgi:diguanylate cyclase (GGDEF)-like protein
MFVEESCLECHNSQGYRIGDVIGAISVSIPVNSLLREIKTNRLIILTGGILTVGLLLGILYFLTWRLVRKLDETQQELKKLASTDELTGLKNRRQIMKRLDEEFERAVRLTAPLCIIVLDIDHFKQINDSYGHPCGDQVLMQVAARLSENLRSYDSIGRIGGEEFLVISPGTAVDEAALLADRLLKTIRGTAFKDGPCTFDITISAGISMLSQADQNIDVLIRRADAALYKAKQGGRDMFVVQ